MLAGLCVSIADDEGEDPKCDCDDDDERYSGLGGEECRSKAEAPVERAGTAEDRAGRGSPEANEVGGEREA